VVYVQADQQTIADYPLGGAPATPTYRYVYASYIDEPVVRKGAGTSGTVHYYHRNQQYSIYAITDAAANIAERYAYTAYGQPTILDAAATVIAASAISNRYTYTAREWDATVGLYHFRARWMSGLTGRFLTRDPIGFKGSRWDLYEFVEGSSLNGLDPSGKILIACTCGCHGGRSIGYRSEVRTVECTGLATSCCSSVCNTRYHNGSCSFTGEWKQVEAEEDDTGIEEEVIDIVDDTVCSFFLVCEVVIPTPGEGVACAAGTKVVCKMVKQCVTMRTPNSPLCKALKLAKELACRSADALGGCGSAPTFGGMSGADCHAREIAWGGCATAREAFQKACFKKGAGGWPGHKQQIGQAKAAARNCGDCASTRP